MATHTITFPGHPCRLNQVEGRHWAVKRKLRLADRQAVYYASRATPPALHKRRVTLTVTLGPRQRGADPDAYWKSVLDALVHAGMLIDDSRDYVELAPVVYDRGPVRRTTITLEDMPGPAPAFDKAGRRGRRGRRGGCE